MGVKGGGQGLLVMGGGSSRRMAFCQRVALDCSATKRQLDGCPSIAVFEMFILVTPKPENATTLMVDQGAGRERA